MSREPQVVPRFVNRINTWDLHLKTIDEVIEFLRLFKDAVPNDVRDSVFLDWLEDEDYIEVQCKQLEPEDIYMNRVHDQAIIEDAIRSRELKQLETLKAKYETNNEI